MVRTFLLLYFVTSFSQFAMAEEYTLYTLTPHSLGVFETQWDMSPGKWYDFSDVSSSFESMNLIQEGGNLWMPRLSVSDTCELLFGMREKKVEFVCKF